MAASGARPPAGRVDEVLELVGLRERGGDKVANYSLGMKQRLGIAGALLNDPQLLLLDEPANGLDPAGIVAMRDTLRHLASTGKTVFISSHLLAEVSQLADMIGIIAAGRLVREGRIETLLSGEGRVRVRVEPDEVSRAVAALAPLGIAARIDGSDSGRASGPANESGWLVVPIAPGRAAEINRTLAAAGIYASGLESGSDLESLFLELTSAGPQPKTPEQTQVVPGNWQ